MRLAVVALIKDESDILPAWLASVARWAHIAVLIDHGSTDGTREMLEAAADARPDWQVWRETNPAYLQEAFTANAIDHVFSRGADWALPLDADELLQVADAEDLTWRLAMVPAGATGALYWINCVASRDAGRWWITPWRAGTTKVAIKRGQWRPGVSLPLGNHHLAGVDGEPVPMSYVADLLHFPLRSVPQMRRKLAQGAAALRMRDGPCGPYQQWTWGAEALSSGDERALLQAWACRYPCPPEPRFARVSDRDFSRWGWRCAVGPLCGPPMREAA